MNLPRQVGNSVPQARWAPITGWPGVPSSSVPAIVPPAMIVRKSSTTAAVVVQRSAREVSSGAACSRSWASRLRVMSRPSSSIAIPRWAATNAVWSPCSTVRPPRIACAITRMPATTTPHTSQRRSRRYLKAMYARAPIRMTITVAATRWLNSMTWCS